MDLPDLDSLTEQVLSSTPQTADDDTEVLGWTPDDPADATIITPSGYYTESLINDDFADDETVPFADQIELSGNISTLSSPFDRDVFDLGPASAGEHVQVDLDITLYSDIVLGLFDDQERLLAYIDHSSYATGPREIDIVLNESTEALRVAMSTRSYSSKDRSYTVNIMVGVGDEPTNTDRQIVVLNFDGAENVRIGNRTPVDVPPFDAANIGEQFAGQTDALIERILDMVNEDYLGLYVDFYTSDDPALPQGDHTVIYFGTYDAALLGLADNIDPYNADTIQSAILYTDTFAIFNSLRPDIEAMSQVLANVTSHEAGHLLGLRHTADINDLMDITASAREMMVDQWFKVADLDLSVMPIGVQDAPAMLEWGIGGNLIQPDSVKLLNRRRPIDIADPADDFYVPRSKLMSCFCHSCSKPDAEN